MINKAIKLIEKQLNMYIIQEENIVTKARKKTIENKVKKALREEIALRKFILEILISEKEKTLENKK